MRIFVSFDFRGVARKIKISQGLKMAAVLFSFVGTSRAKAILQGWHDKMKFYIDQFVEEFSEYIGRRYCLTTSHCTDAIHLALLSINLKPGDIIIVPVINFISTINLSIFHKAKIYYSDNPLTDNWIPHKKNPIFVDSKKARMGGILFDKNMIYMGAKIL